MKFETVNLKNRKKPHQVTALVCQFRFNEDDWVHRKDLPFLKDITIINDYLEHVKYAVTNYGVDLVVMPELSVPHECIGELCKLSREEEIIIIGGTHYFERQRGGMISRCPVIVDGELFYTEKINPSPLEISPIIGNGLTAGSTFSIFKNTSAGNFAVVICADYLDSRIRAKLSKSNLDFVVIIAFQKESEQYHQRMNVGCEELEVGSYFLYSNVRCAGAADGKSGLFGLMDKIFSSKLVDNGHTDGNPQTKLVELNSNDKVSYFVAEFDIKNKKPSFLRNIFTKPNVSIRNIDNTYDKVLLSGKTRTKFDQLKINIDKRRESVA